MKKVRIICGTYGHQPEGSKIVKAVVRGETVDLPDDKAERLVKLGVAEYVNEPATAQNGEYVPDGTPIGFDEMPPEDFGEVESEDEAETMEEIIDLATLSAKELRTIGTEYGLTFKANAKKTDMIEAITAAQAQLANDAEDAPTFDAAEAVEA